jgi:hypothetical protein
MAIPRKVRTPLRVIGQVRRRKKRGRNKISEEESEQLPKLKASEVYLEDPTEVNQQSDAMIMDVIDFWNFAYRSYWRGRMRVCDGELMRKLIECFDDLAQNKILAKIVTTRNYCMLGTKRDTSRALWQEEEKVLGEEEVSFL